MIAICNSFTFLEIYHSDSVILPSGYKKIYTSGVFGMDNKYQVYQKDNVAVINLRGSTDEQISWVENIYSAMIPAKGTIQIEGEKIKYSFARESGAAVHSGYALAIAYLQKELLDRVSILNREGIYDFIITGHSQGGALANMLMAYLQNLSHHEISEKNNFKTYAFAAPMIGNKVFVAEYNERFSAENNSFNIINPADLIPSLPLNYNDTNYIKGNLRSFLFDRESFSFAKLLTDGGVLLFEDKIGQLINRMGTSASKKIGRDVGEVVMPEYVKDINYHKINTQLELDEFDYPKILKDSSILQNDSLMQVYQRGNDGYFLDDKLYKKGSWTFQHKPYNYYVAVLKMYFPGEFNLLSRKYLPENL